MAKVLSIVPYKIFPARVGGQKGIALFNEYFAKEVELTCITVKSNPPGYAKGYKVENLLSDGSHRYGNPLYYNSIKAYIRKNKVTHLLLEHPYFGWLGILLKKATGVFLVVHSHNIESTRWKSLGKWWWKLLWTYEKATHRFADFNFFIHDEDRQFAIQKFGLNSAKCITVSYGIEVAQPVEPGERSRCKAILQQTHHIASNETIFLFNGALDYKPNYDAVLTIVNKINPFLFKHGSAYKIIICGRGLPTALNSLQEFAEKHIIYAGFVDDISIYFKGADVFINPVVDGGGIKTKLVEALGYGTKAVSTRNGSIGLSAGMLNGMLQIVPDHEWQQFAGQMMISASQPPLITPDAFYDHFYWGNIARKAAAFIGATQ